MNHQYPHYSFFPAARSHTQLRSKTQTAILIVVLTALTFAAVALPAQVEDPKFTFNFGAGPGFPQGRISDFADTGAHIVAGGGMNLTHMIGANAEFMWHDLPPKDEIIALTGAPDGSARQYSVTGNLILKTPPARFGGYAIGGVGWYHRSWELTAPTLSIGTVCVPSYVWWGVVCGNGLVQSTAILQSGSSDAFGWNGGVGATFRLGESPAKIYTEVRYHQASHDRITTKILPLTFGIRW